MHWEEWPRSPSHVLYRYCHFALDHGATFEAVPDLGGVLQSNQHFSMHR